MARPLALAAIMGTGILLNGCVSVPKSCRGLAPPRYIAEVRDGIVVPRRAEILGEDPLRRLQCEADRADPTAMVALGLRYETGDGVPQDARRAAELYERAAADIPATTAVYSPPVRLGGNGQMLFLNNPNAGPGLAKAKFRLGLLYMNGSGVARNETRGRSLIETAAALGDAEAQQYIGAKSGQAN